jgi:hypothetical protein
MVTGRRDGAPAALAWLAHPLTLSALVVLLLNDHLLKAEFPGLLTGKLSDAAGLVVAPPLLAGAVLLLVPKLPAHATAAAATLVTGAGFALAKTTGAGADVAGVLGHVVVDPTDLLTLPALGLAWHAWRRARRRPAPGRVARLVRLAVVLPIALVGVAATEAPAPVPYADAAQEQPDGIGLVVGHWNSYGDYNYGDSTVGTLILVSIDAKTWQNVRVPVNVTTLAQPTACASPDPLHCFRVVPGALAIEESADGGVTWTRAFGVSAADREQLADLFDLGGDLDPHALLACRSLLISPVPDGYVVIAACGLDGFYVRGADAVWQRIGIPPNPPAVLHGASPFAIDRKVDGLLLVAWLVLVAGMEALAEPHPRGILALVTAGALFVGAIGFVPAGPRLTAVLFTLTVLVPALVYLGLQARRRVLRWEFLLCAAVTVLAIGAAPHGWYSISVASAGIIAAVVTARRRRRTLATAPGQTPPGRTLSS